MAAHPVDIFVGTKLRARRIMLGLSQEAIGKPIGVSFQQVQKYERGVNRMGSSRLYDFSKLLNVPISYFFEGYENKGFNNSYGEGVAEESDGYEHEKMTSRETLELMRAYYSIRDEKTRKRFSDLLKSVAEQDELSEETA